MHKLAIKPYEPDKQYKVGTCEGCDWQSTYHMLTRGIWVEYQEVHLPERKPTDRHPLLHEVYPSKESK